MMRSEKIHEILDRAKSKAIPYPSSKSKYKNVRFGLLCITPAVAEYLLRNYKDNDSANRTRSTVRVNEYKEKMLNGTFVPIVGDTIDLDRSYNADNGQHRLDAIIKSGKTYYLPVVFNVPKEIKAIRDSGRAKSPADRLKMVYGVKNANAKSPMVNMYYKLINNCQSNRCPDVHEAYTVIDKHGTTINQINKILFKENVIGRSPVRGALLFAADKFPRQTLEFTKKLQAMENLNGRDKAIIAFNRFAMKQGAGGARRVEAKPMALTTLTALKYYITGSKVPKQLEWPTTQAKVAGLLNYYRK
jgi:hypothetical protein